MAERVSRWACYGLALGLLPLLLSYGVRRYYLAGPATVEDVLGAGDALLVVVTWSATALLDLSAARPGWARTAVSTVTIAVLTIAAVAYGCRTADSVTGRVQTGTQARIVAHGSLAGLAVAALLSCGAAALAAPREEDGTR